MRGSKHKKFDTTALRTEIKAIGMGIPDFAQSASDLCGNNWMSIQTRIYGNGSLPDSNEIAAFSVLLNKSEDEIKSMIGIPIKDNAPKTKKMIAPVQNVHTAEKATYIVDYNVIDRARVRRSITQTQINEAIKAAGGSFRWKNDRISHKDAVSLSQILGEDLEDLFKIKVGKTPAQAGVQWYKGDMDAISKLMVQHYLNVADFEAAIGATSHGVYYKWVRGRKINRHYAEKICELFKVRIEDLFTPADAPNTGNTNSCKSAHDLKSKKDSTTLKSVEGKLDVFDVFRTLNDNLQTMTDIASKQNEDLAIKMDAVVMAMKDSVAALTQHVNIIESKVDRIITDMEEKEKEKPKIVPIKDERDTMLVWGDMISTPEMIESMPIDTLAHYTAKINAMATQIGRKNGETRDDVLHRYYREMNKTYGVVWDQLKLEYSRKYGRSQSWSLALLYEHPLYKSIFHNLMTSEYINKVKAANTAK